MDILMKSKRILWMPLIAIFLSQSIVYGVELSHYTDDNEPKIVKGMYYGGTPSNLQYVYEESFFRLVVGYPQSLQPSDRRGFYCANRACMEDYGATHYGTVFIMSRSNKSVTYKVKRMTIATDDAKRRKLSFYQSVESNKLLNKVLFFGNIARSLNKTTFDESEMESILYYGINLADQPKSLHLVFEIDVYRPLTFETETINRSIHLNLVKKDIRSYRAGPVA